MGDILNFKRSEMSVKTNSEPLPMGGAEILFFTGVRYVRLGDDQVMPPVKSPSRQSGRVRKPRRRA